MDVINWRDSINNIIHKKMIEYLDRGFEWFSKGLEIVRSMVIKISSWLPWEPEFSLAVLFLALSVFLSYKFVSKFTVHPFSTQNIIYLILQALMFFIIFMYL